MVEEKCGCSICENRIDFELPNEIIDAIINEKLVIFAGAGVSTESKMVYGYTLYDEILIELSMDYESDLDFPKLMSKYCEVNGKAELVRKIKFRFDYVKSFPELYSLSTKFHKELSTLYQIKDIITTNWDDFFEKECGATPIVTPEDFIFWDIPERKVFKVHGSINNLGSIVVTEEDYEKCYNNLKNGVIGSFLKMLLATKVILFMGYSFRDKDFIKIYNSLKDEMKEFMPSSYIVTLDNNSKENFKKIGLKPIITDATYFLEILKQHLVKNNLLLDEEIFKHVYLDLMRANDAHEKVSAYFDLTKNPEIIYTLSYQDGLIHAFERIIAMQSTGEYSNLTNIISVIESYEQLLMKKIDKNAYNDIAYIEGYITGHIHLIIDNSECENVPLYYLLGHEEDIKTFKEYKKRIGYTKSNYEDAFNFAAEITSKIDEDVVIHHPPLL